MTGLLTHNFTDSKDLSNPYWINC